jgi:hypothetical protein
MVDKDFVLVSPLTELMGFDPKTRGGEDVDVEKFWGVLGFGTELNHWLPTSIRGKVDAERRRGRHLEAAQYLSKKGYPYKAVRKAPVSSTIIYRRPEKSVLALIQESRDAGSRQGGLMWRIIIGFCLYLRMLSTDTPHVGTWQRARRARTKQGDFYPHPITEGAEICEVRSMKKLTVADRDLFFRYATGKLTGIELQCHFREGHWRRPPGKGNDPNAKKTVQVDPTIVRPDKWPADGLPLGRQVTVPIQR